MQRKFKAISPVISELNLGYFSENTLNLTEFARMSKSKIDLEFGNGSGRQNMYI